jgi:hypothetical protein
MRYVGLFRFHPLSPKYTVAKIPMIPMIPLTFSQFAAHHSSISVLLSPDLQAARGLASPHQCNVDRIEERIKEGEKRP